MPTHANAPPSAVLVTRPEPGASETAARLVAMGFEAVLAPVLAVQARTLASVGAPQAVLVTSGNALPALPESLHRTLLLAVGDATAARAKSAGFKNVISAGKDAAALAELVARVCQPDAGALLLASGAGQGLKLVTDLRARGFRVRRRVAYAAHPVAALPGAARIALDGGHIGAALFFSPETARVFMTILQRDMPPTVVRPIRALALSAATAAPLRGLPWHRVSIASHPTQDDLLALLS